MRPHPPSTDADPPFEEKFRYGWRFVKRTLADGSTELEQVPLTLEDVLHPQPDDEIPVRPIHALDCRYLADVFETRPLGPPIVYVSFDHLVDWGVPGQRDTSPDVAVFVGLAAQPEPEADRLHLKESGGRCLLAVEVVSPHTRDNDVVHKFREYYQAGVPLYVIVDQDPKDGLRKIVGYRHCPDGYQQLSLDEQGRLLLQPLNLWLGLRDRRVVCYDASSGKELPDYVKLTQALHDVQRRQAELTQVQEEVERLKRELAQNLSDAQEQDAEERIRLVKAKLQRLRGTRPV
jgi:Uma2 family endonuclease